MDEDDGLIRVDIDVDVLDKVGKIFAKDGYTLEEAITLFLEESLKVEGFPFEIKGK